ncbi:MAG: DUF933 domain-containing protein [Dehalococcoidia bacterium]
MPRLDRRSEGITAPRAAGKIHSDLERGFIRAEVVRYEDLVAAGSRRRTKRSLLRTEGKGYVVQDGDMLPSSSTSNGPACRVERAPSRRPRHGRRPGRVGASHPPHPPQTDDGGSSSRFRVLALPARFGPFEQTHRFPAGDGTHAVRLTQAAGAW